MDKAVELRSETVEDIHQDIESQVRHLRSLHTERFKGLERRLLERDLRAATEKVDAKVAVDAAFAAAKEAAAKQDEANAKAIDKSERATAETIKTNQELTKSTTDNLTKDVDTLKTQVATILATGIGRTQQRGETTRTELPCTPRSAPSSASSCSGSPSLPSSRPGRRSERIGDLCGTH